MSSPGEALRDLRKRKPLIHQITNYVVMNETANATLAVGALPVMAHAIEEVEQMASFAGALVLNIGTLSQPWIDAMLLAGKSANAAGTPVVLDPVGVGATALRTDTAKRILAEVDVAVVRGNPAEVAALAGIASEIRGVEWIGAAAEGAAEAAQLPRYGGAQKRKRRDRHDCDQPEDQAVFGQRLPFLVLVEGEDSQNYLFGP